MIIRTNGWEIAKKLKPEKIFLRNFLGATTQCMADYMKPWLRAKPNHLILHAGTNDLNSNRSSDEIAKAIVDLVSELKSAKFSVSISSIVMRVIELNKKGSQDNHHLKEMCNRKNFFLIDHSKKFKAIHLNSGRLHLNRKGANILSSSLKQHILEAFNSQLLCNTLCFIFYESDFEENESSNLKQTKENCKDNLDKLVFSHLSINSIRNKFYYLSEHIRGNVDILLVSKTKIDDSFLQSQFNIDVFRAPYRLDRNCLVGGLLLFVRDFNVTDDEHHMKSFCENYGLRNLIRHSTCYKNQSNSVCIDLILTNLPRSFQSICVVETGLSDFHLMNVTVMRKGFKKYQPKTISYRSSKKFSNEKH